MARRLAPGLYFAIREKRRTSRGAKSRRGPHHEMKAAYLNTLKRLSEGRVVLDIGANKGWYCLELAQVAKRVVAFEPNPLLAEELKTLMECSPYNVEVKCLALSDHSGKAELRIPVKRTGSATLDTDNRHVNELQKSEEVRTVSVKLERLDDVDVGHIDTVKIDVEGHQLPLLEGARKTLEQYKPEILIEVDDRHRVGSVQAVDGWMRAVGYRGYYLLGPALMPMELFQSDLLHGSENHKSGKIRINDFFYFHESKLRDAQQRLADLHFFSA